MERAGRAVRDACSSAFRTPTSPTPGSSAVVVTDGDAAQARALCDELLDMAWNAREKFVYQVEPLAAVAGARARAWAPRSARPVVLLDHYDNCASGGTMDTMAVLGGDPRRRASRTSPRSRSSIRRRWSR